MDDSLRVLLARRLGSPVTHERSLPGGDINDAHALTLEDGRRLFLKTQRRAPPGFFESEALGLDWLRAAAVIRIPRVIAVADATDPVPFLVLELLESAPPQRLFDEVLGQRLAALHQTSPGTLGFPRDNFIGLLPQSNATTSSWAEFWRARRLEPQLRRCVDAGRASYTLRRGFERLFASLPELLGPEEAPARLHGDLWGGNLHVDDAGEPALLDPAVYAGSREVDLAMMRLFGGFSERVFQAYAEAYPLAPGADERVTLYQLYPLLVHANLFGGSYARSVERALAQYV
ncbi:MAG TPA: fructosamine kinase family protein [Polyangiaceae bacterium]|nr:fructosamine kinase family protein [Polyangiaceae bacterium]